MNQLVSYIKAIHRQTSPVTLTRQQSEGYSEQDESGTVIRHQITTYWFADEVVIRYQTEQDETPCEQLCGECWISYRVISSPIPITPSSKLFHNHCQERYWLKMQGISK